MSGAFGTLGLAAVVDAGIVELRGQARELVIKRGCNGHCRAILCYLQIGAVAELRDLLPEPQSLGLITALDGVDTDAALPRQRKGLRIIDVVLIVHVRRRIADQENNAIGICILPPGDGMDGIMQRLVDTLRAVTAAVCLKLEQGGMQCVQVWGQIHHLRHIVVTPVAIGDQAHTDAWCRLGRSHGGSNGPDLILRGLDQPAHAAGGIEHEHRLDHWLLLLRRCDSSAARRVARCRRGCLRIIQGGQVGKGAGGGGKQGNTDQNSLALVRVHWSFSRFYGVSMEWLLVLFGRSEHEEPMADVLCALAALDDCSRLIPSARR